MSLTSQI